MTLDYMETLQDIKSTYNKRKISVKALHKNQKDTTKKKHIKPQSRKYICNTYTATYS